MVPTPVLIRDKNLFGEINILDLLWETTLDLFGEEYELGFLPLLDPLTFYVVDGTLIFLLWSKN